jgi:hypothetical protein
MREKFPDTHFVAPQEPKSPAHDLVRLVIAEAPGKRESEVGEPLRGKAGQFFDNLLDDAGIQRDGLTITNCLSCRPPHNIFPQTAGLGRRNDATSRKKMALKRFNIARKSTSIRCFALANGIVWTLLEATPSESSHGRRGLANGEAVRLNCLADTKQ